MEGHNIGKVAVPIIDSVNSLRFPNQQPKEENPWNRKRKKLKLR
jgi:hypothetical protein